MGKIKINFDDENLGTVVKISIANDDPNEANGNTAEEFNKILQVLKAATDKVGITFNPRVIDSENIEIDVDPGKGSETAERIIRVVYIIEKAYNEEGDEVEDFENLVQSCSKLSFEEICNEMEVTSD